MIKETFFIQSNLSLNEKLIHSVALVIKYRDI